MMDNPFDWSGPVFLKLFVWLLAAACAAAVLVRWLVTRSTAGADAGLDAYEVAYLVGGPPRVALVVVTGLIDRRTAVLTGRHLTIVERDGKAAHALHRRLLSMDPPTMPVRQVGRVLAPEIDQLRKTLQSEGLLARDEGIWLSRAVTLVLLGLLLTAGVVKTGVGISRDRPVGFLILLCLLTVFGGVVLLRGPFRTSAGRRVLGRLREHTPKPWRRTNGGDILVALWGLEALTSHIAYADLRRSYGTTAGGGESGGSGCGSGGCGGGGGSSCGGGGCGGCGGGH